MMPLCITSDSREFTLKNLWKTWFPSSSCVHVHVVVIIVIVVVIVIIIIIVVIIVDVDIFIDQKNTVDKQHQETEEPKYWKLSLLS